MKKFLTFVLSIALVLCLVTTAFAAQVTQTVDKTTVPAGEDVTVTLTLDEKLSDVVSFQFDLYFDADVFTLKSSANGTAHSRMTVSNLKSNAKGSYYAVSVIDPTSAGMDIEAGTVYTFVFTAVSNVASPLDGIFTLECNSVDDPSFNSIDVSASAPITVTVTLPACKHANTNIINAKSASCKEEGYTGDTYCEDCNTVIETGSTIAKLAHSEKVVNAKEATCEAEGYTGDTVCSDCGETIKTGSVIAKKAHTEKVVNAKEATCEAEGYTGDTVCSVCGEELEKGKAIAKTEHNWNWVVDKKATATESGLKHEECADCHTKRNENTVIPATGEGLDDVPQTSDLTLTVLPIVLVVLAVIGTSVLVTKRKAVK